MKDRLNVLLLVLWLTGSCASVVLWLLGFSPLTLALPALPSFCSQLLLCRVTGHGVLRALPVLPVAALLALGGWYYVFGSGWDRLVTLICGLAAIAPAVGVALGWLVWWLVFHRKKAE